jgi:threonine dehydrogenase-like Zn-dependent dehydrogenase
MSPAASTVASSEYVLAGPRSLQWQTRTLPDLARGWVRVGYLYCGLCGSDLSTFEGRRDVAYPVSLGHEFIAEVTEVGADVEALAPGDIVTSDLNYRCGTCDQCRAHRSHLCHRGQDAIFSNRAFAERGDLDASYLVRLKGGVRRHLALTEPLSCVIHAKEWATLEKTDRVLVIGAGGLGSCMAFALCRQAPAVAFEITDEMASRLALIKAAVAPLGQAVAHPQGEYDVVFDLSGSESGLRLACTHTRPGGRLCSMSHLDGYSTADFLLGSLTRRDVTFTVSYRNGERETLGVAIELLERGWSPAWDRLVEVVPLDQLQDAFENRRRAPWCKTLIEGSWPSP